MRIIAIVTCYYPCPELLLRSIESYAYNVDKLIIWRNSTLSSDLESELSVRFKAAFRGDGTNVGISRALNCAWKEAVDEGYDCLLTMDQDSVWHGFDAYLLQAATNGFSDCIYSPRLCSMGEMPATEDKLFLAPIDLAFTSGMLVPVKVLDIIGGWDENLILDAVDVDFCLHAYSLGIKCWRCSAGWLEHRLGSKRQASFLGMHFYTYNYPPERLYGIYRNHIIVLGRYKGAAKKQARKAFTKTWGGRRPIRILLGENNKRAKFHAIIRGIRDGIMGRIMHR